MQDIANVQTAQKAKEVKETEWAGTLRLARFAGDSENVAKSFLVQDAHSKLFLWLSFDAARVPSHSTPKQLRHQPSPRQRRRRARGMRACPTT